MKHKLLYVTVGVLALAVAVPLATRALAQTPTPTATTPQTTTAPQFQGMGPGMMGARGHMGGAGLLRDFQTLKRVATLLKTTPQDLFTQLDSGKTVAAIATEKGVKVEDVAATILAPFKDEIQIRVKYGDISQEQADFQVFVRTQELVKLLSQPIRQAAPNAIGKLAPGRMMVPNGAGVQGATPNGMMDPQSTGGMMGGGMMNGGMMGGGSGLTW